MTFPSRVAGRLPLLLAVLSGGCSDDVSQHVVVIDTDLPVVDQIVRSPELSFAASVDTVRIDALDEKGVFDSLTVVAPGEEDWPISFGVAPHGARLRIRIFRGELADVGEDGELEPPAAVSVERLIDLSEPSGVEVVLVRLSGDCMGVPSSLSGGETCLDSDRPFASASRAFSRLSGSETPSTRAGTWRGALLEPCREAPPADRQCIPGGFSMLGEKGLVGYIDGVDFRLDPYPLRPVLVSPFHFDRYEFTVGRLRSALRAGPLAGPMPETNVASSPNLRSCTWHGPDVDDFDDLPLNCIPRSTALELCARDGGTLPSEAQWEHAARGHGRQLDYPWGFEAPDCCTASLERVGPSLCGVGVENVGSHPPATGCSNIGDRSVEGVEDLAGSVQEMTLDSHLPYDGECWARPGVRRDPVCTEDNHMTYTVRGGAWNSERATALSAIRRSSIEGYGVTGVGFRCAYPDASR